MLMEPAHTEPYIPAYSANVSEKLCKGQLRVPWLKSAGDHSFGLAYTTESHQTTANTYLTFRARVYGRHSIPVRRRKCLRNVSLTSHDHTTVESVYGIGYELVPACLSPDDPLKKPI